jgi:hypothetical protein
MWQENHVICFFSYAVLEDPWNLYQIPEPGADKNCVKIRKCYRPMQIKIGDFGQNPWGQSADKNGQTGNGPDPHADKIWHLTGSIPIQLQLKFLNHLNHYTTQLCYIVYYVSNMWHSFFTIRSSNVKDLHSTNFNSHKKFKFKLWKLVSIKLLPYALWMVQVVQVMGLLLSTSRPCLEKVCSQVTPGKVLANNILVLAIYSGKLEDTTGSLTCQISWQHQTFLFKFSNTFLVFSSRLFIQDRYYM